MCDKAVLKDSFMLKHFLDTNKTKKICDKAVNDFLPVFVSNWFVRSKMIKKLHNSLFAENDILVFDEDSRNVTFSGDEVGIPSVDINNINLDDVNFDKNDP